MAEKLQAELEKIEREITELQSQVPKAKDYDTMKKLQNKVERLRFKKDRELLPRLKVAEEKEKTQGIIKAKKRLIKIGEQGLERWNLIEQHRVAVRRLLDELDGLRKENYALHKRFNISGPPVPLNVRNEVRAFTKSTQYTVEHLDKGRIKSYGAIKRSLEDYKERAKVG